MTDPLPTREELRRMIRSASTLEEIDLVLELADAYLAEHPDDHAVEMELEQPAAIRELLIASS